ncbi:hypothetical protein HGRIS_011671 [Hohenbuehelia grisea]|uniref:Uncharacterized protein n=1 Tax=Hohenbuehelia grisea TaxID=104357 RepID=A0ABR3JXJ0_9AGAR
MPVRISQRFFLLLASPVVFSGLSVSYAAPAPSADPYSPSTFPSFAHGGPSIQSANGDQSAGLAILGSINSEKAVLDPRSVEFCARDCDDDDPDCDEYDSDDDDSDRDGPVKDTGSLSNKLSPKARAVPTKAEKFEDESYSPEETLPSSAPPQDSNLGQLKVDQSGPKAVNKLPTPAFPRGLVSHRAVHHRGLSTNHHRELQAPQVHVVLSPASDPANIEPNLSRGPLHVVNFVIGKTEMPMGTPLDPSLAHALDTALAGSPRPIEQSSPNGSSASSDPPAGHDAAIGAQSGADAAPHEDNGSSSATGSSQPPADEGLPASLNPIASLLQTHVPLSVGTALAVVPQSALHSGSPSVSSEAPSLYTSLSTPTDATSISISVHTPSSASTKTELSVTSSTSAFSSHSATVQPSSASMHFWGPGLAAVSGLSRMNTVVSSPTQLSPAPNVSSGAHRRAVTYGAIGCILVFSAVVLSGIGCVLRSRAAKARASRGIGSDDGWDIVEAGARRGGPKSGVVDEKEKRLLASPAISEVGLQTGEDAERRGGKGKRKDSLESHRQRLPSPQIPTINRIPTQVVKPAGRALVVDGKLSSASTTRREPNTNSGSTSGAADAERVIDIKAYDLGSRFSVTSTDYPCSEDFGSLPSMHSLEIVDIELADNVKKFVSFDVDKPVEVPRIEEPVRSAPVAPQVEIPVVSPQVMAALAMMTTPELETTALLGAHALEGEAAKEADTVRGGNAFWLGSVNEEAYGTPKKGRAGTSARPASAAETVFSVGESMDESDRATTSECRPQSCVETIASRYPSSRFTRGSGSEWEIALTYAQGSQGQKSVASLPYTGVGDADSMPGCASVTEEARRAGAAAIVKSIDEEDVGQESRDGRGSAYTMYRRSDWQLDAAN